MYLTQLSDSQFKVIEKIVPELFKRRRKYQLSQIFASLLYHVKTGGCWRSLPHDFPNWSTVYYYYRKYTRNGILKRILEALTAMARKRAGQEATPTLVIIDSQSVKHDAFVAEEVGYDGGKHIKGRKYQIAVDKFGFLIAVVVHSARIHDSQGLEMICQALKDNCPKLKVLLVDQGYQGDKQIQTARNHGFELKVVTKKAGQFKPIPIRWVVERTHAWHGRHRRLVRNYEHKTEHQTSMIYLAHINMRLKDY